jgi:SAM-dependent methyltransferase
MHAKEFEFLFKLEETFWWFVGMRAITDTIVAPQINGGQLRILDAGCGTGFNLHHYRSHNMFALEIDTNAIGWVGKRGSSKIAQASVTEIPYASSTFDLVFSFDVLQQIRVEQVPDALREMHRVLKPGGHLFARVAALEWMRSSHDEEVKTIHRFTKNELTGMVAAAGFELEYDTYANMLLFPVVVLRRFLKSVGIGRGSDVRPLPGALQWVDPLFRRILLLENRIFRGRRTLPFGLSVICYARKPFK